MVLWSAENLADKNSIRTKNILLRKKLDRDSASKKIVSKILSSRFFSNSKNVLIFYPMKYEIDLRALVHHPSSAGKNFFLPKVFENNLLICPYTERLIKSSFGIMEPLSAPISNIEKIDLVLVPCVCIDKKLNRLGYGKGFYDRLFSNSRFRAYKVAVLNKELVVESIPADASDKRVDYLITD